MRNLFLRSAAFVAVLCALTPGGALAQQRVGIDSAVNPQATGTPPGGAARPIVIGQDVLFNERIATAEKGQTQLLFVDESSMTVGPNSDLTIDQFVYDPKTGSGRLAMSATRGLLRYVGGKLSKHDGAVTLRTSTATLAVRGGAFIVDITANGQTTAVLIYGNSLTIANFKGAVQTITQPGFEVTISPVGAMSAPVAASTTFLSQVNNQLDGQPGGNGGTNTGLNNSTATQGTTSLTQTLVQALQNVVGAPVIVQPITTITNGQNAQQGASPTGSIDCEETSSCPPGTPPIVPTTPPPSVYAPTGSTRIFAFTVQPDAALQSNIPFIRSQAGGNLPNASVSPFYIVAPPTTAIGDASTASAARGLQASLAVNGQGANQQSVIAVTTGTIDTLQSSGQPVLVGAMRGSSMISANGTPTTLSSGVSTAVDGNGNSLYGGTTIPGFVLDQTTYGGTPGSGVVSTPNTAATASETPLSGAPTNYGFAQPAIPANVPPGVGASRTTQTLAGSFGGLMYTNAQSTPYIVTGSAMISTDAPNNRIAASLTGSAQTPSSGVSSISLEYGGLTGNAAGHEAFVDDSTFGVLESASTPQQITVNETTSNPTGQLYLVSSGAAGQPTSLLANVNYAANTGLPGAGQPVAYCQCQYLQWGYWGGSLTGNTTPASSTPRIDAANINTWVAGSPTPLANLQTLETQSATANYTGAAIGSVFNNGASYLAAGGFQGSYNFGSQTGSVLISNFDGHNFAAAGSAPLSGANYSFAGTAAGVNGTVNGTFYGPNAAETGGNFAFHSIAGPTYLASGVFAGKQ